jgi:hypothetical protein
VNHQLRVHADPFADLDDRAELAGVGRSRWWWRLRWWTGSARLTFGDWRRTRPFWAGVWTLIGGAVLVYAPMSAFQIVLTGNGVWPGILVGALVMLCGVALWFELQLIRFLGCVIILVSLVSFVTSTFGGFMLGMLLGITGGALALAWEPPVAPAIPRPERSRPSSRPAGRGG